MATFETEIEAPARLAVEAMAVMENHGLKVEWAPTRAQSAIEDPLTERDPTGGAIAWGEIVVATIVAIGAQEVWNAAKAEIQDRWPHVKIRVRPQRDHDAEPPPDR